MSTPQAAIGPLVTSAPQQRLQVAVSSSTTNVEGQLDGVRAIQLYAGQSAADLAFGGLSGAPAWAQVRRMAETLLEPAGPGYFPAWRRPIFRAAQIAESTQASRG
ncbi:hypothetical protein [Streptomyces sp. NPDC047009]|uniref:hypothetical protein n=1 Tax=unclassified Streptomyces TaxID=2593676 RepID=UPI0033D46913